MEEYESARLDPVGRKEAIPLYLKQALCALYRILLYRQNSRLYHTVALQETTSFNLLLITRSLLVDGEATYLAQVMELEKQWADLPGVKMRGAAPFPFRFSNEERAEIETDITGGLHGMEAMQGVKATLDELFPVRGDRPA